MPPGACGLRPPGRAGYGRGPRQRKTCRKTRASCCPTPPRTKIVITMNARELRHFFAVRCCKPRQWEMDGRWPGSCAGLVRRGGARTSSRAAAPACLHGTCPEGKMTCGRPYKLADVDGPAAARPLRAPPQAARCTRGGPCTHASAYQRAARSRLPWALVALGARRPRGGRPGRHRGRHDARRDQLVARRAPPGRQHRLHDWPLGELDGPLPGAQGAGGARRRRAGRISWSSACAPSPCRPTSPWAKRNSSSAAKRSASRWWWPALFAVALFFLAPLVRHRPVQALGGRRPGPSGWWRAWCAWPSSWATWRSSPASATCVVCSSTTAPST